MILAIIEGGFLLGIIVLIWVLLDVLGGAHPADDKRQGNASTG